MLPSGKSDVCERFDVFWQKKKTAAAVPQGDASPQSADVSLKPVVMHDATVMVHCA